MITLLEKIRYILFPPLSMGHMKNRHPGLKRGYDAPIFLDAETIARGSLKSVYEHDIMPRLKYFVDPKPVIEEIDWERHSYYILFGGERYRIFGPKEASYESIGRATHTLFTIVNHQLKDHEVKFYARGSSFELSGIFLTSEQFDASQTADLLQFEIPYIPTLEPPFYGEPK